MLTVIMMVTSYLLTGDCDTDFTQQDYFTAMFRLQLPTELKNLQCLFYYFSSINNAFPISFISSAFNIYTLTVYTYSEYIVTIYNKI